MRFFKDITFCVYCGSSQSADSMGCCGESSQHFETGYIETDAQGREIGDEILTESEVDTILSEIDGVFYV